MPAPTYRSRIGYRDPSFTYRGVSLVNPGGGGGGGGGGQFFFPPTDGVVSPIYIDDQDDYYPVDPLMQRLMRHYEQQQRGRDVFLLSDGTFTEDQPPNWNPEQPSAPYARDFNASSGQVVITEFFQVPYIVKVYWGGVNNAITAAEALALQDAGYVTT